MLDKAKPQHKVAEKMENKNNELETKVTNQKNSVYDAALGVEIPAGITEVTEYVAKTKEQEIAEVIAANKEYTTTAPNGLVYSEEVAKIAGMTCTIQRQKVSLQSILYQGLKIVDRNTKPTEKLYGGYTRQQCMNNVRLMRAFLPEEFEKYAILQMSSNSESDNRERINSCSFGRKRRC